MHRGVGKKFFGYPNPPLGAQACQGVVDLFLGMNYKIFRRRFAPPKNLYNGLPYSFLSQKIKGFRRKIKGICRFFPYLLYIALLRPPLFLSHFSIFIVLRGDLIKKQFFSLIEVKTDIYLFLVYAFFWSY